MGPSRVSQTPQQQRHQLIPLARLMALKLHAPAFELEQETRVPGLKVGGGLDVALDYDTADAGLQDLDGYTVVNAWAEYVPPSVPNLTIRAEVDNLFDEQYADRATYGAEFGSVTPLREPGRTISLVAVAKF